MRSKGVFVFKYDPVSDQYIQEYTKGYTKRKDYGLLFFIISLIIITATAVNVFSFYSAQLGVTDSAIDGNLIALIAIGLGFVAAAIFAIVSRGKNKKFLAWLVERYRANYPEIGKMFDEGVKYKNKELEKLLGQAIKADHDNIFPNIEYNYNDFYNDYLFQHEFKGKPLENPKYIDQGSKEASTKTEKVEVKETEEPVELAAEEEEIVEEEISEPETSEKETEYIERIIKDSSSRAKKVFRL